MTQSEGVIQYTLDFTRGALPADCDPTPLLDWFSRCRARNLIGQDPALYDGYAYGNISLRAPRGFIISGTQTGGKSTLQASDLAWVLDFDSATNQLRATGPARPSSEAMTHGEIYRALPEIAAVIHVHSPQLWQAAGALGLATTDPTVGYGTPAMADAVRQLLITRPSGGVIAMGGHEDGIIAYGTDMDAAGAYLIRAFSQAQNRSEYY